VRQPGWAAQCTPWLLQLAVCFACRAPVLKCLLSRLRRLQARRPRPRPSAGITQELLRAHAAAVAGVALDRLLEHLRRGKAGELWAALHAELASRLAAYEAAAPAALARPSAATGLAEALPPAAAAAGRSLGRAVLHVAQAVAYIRGSRVEAYGPLFDALGHLAQLPTVWLPTAPAAAIAAAAPAAAPGDDVDAEALLAGPQPLLHVSLSAAVLDLAKAMCLAHAKAAGESQGPAALARCVAAWAPCFGRPPAGELLPFVKALMVWPAGPDVAHVFAPLMLGCLGRIAAGGGDAGSSSSHSGMALLLLVDLCNILQPKVSGRAGRHGAGMCLAALLPLGICIAQYKRDAPGCPANCGLCKAHPMHNWVVHSHTQPHALLRLQLQE
jgi:U3 small nucleolar RNA-associated protein 20